MYDHIYAVLLKHNKEKKQLKGGRNEKGERTAGG
jgi:hypothetical protein